MPSSDATRHPLCVTLFALAAALTLAWAGPVFPDAVRPGELEPTAPPDISPLMSSESGEPGVAVLALGSVDLRKEELTREFERLLGRQFDGGSLFDLQMEITRATMNFGPVLLLAADPSTDATVRGECKRYKICDAIEKGMVRITIVPHQGEWIRDYGPQFGVVDNITSVVNARYHEQDLEADIWRKLQIVNLKRKEVIEKLMRIRNRTPDESGLGDDQEDISSAMSATRSRQLSSQQPEATPREVGPDDAIAELLSHSQSPKNDEVVSLEQQLADLRELADLLSNQSTFQRYGDERVAFNLAESILKEPNFALYRAPIALDGGNIFHFPDGECITSTDLINENDGIERRVRLALSQYYGCKRVHYLQPLPGPGTIKHVDMFILPVSGKKVLLAWYDPTAEPLRHQWSQLRDEQKALIVDAAVAMRKNEHELQRSGFEVIRVPALPPEIDGESAYYKTVLNAVVRTRTDGRRQILLPYYKGSDLSATQERAVAIVKEAFGSNSEVVQLESTKAAKRQGAIHCLTLIIPEAMSTFADPEDRQIRAEISSSTAAIEQEWVHKLGYSLEGSWVDADTPSDEKEIRIAPATLTIGDPAEDDATVSYEVYRKNTREWYLSFKYEDSDSEETTGKVLWEGPDTIKLQVGTGAPHDLHRKVTQDPSG